LADDSGSPGNPQSQLQRPGYFRKSTAWSRLEAAVGPSEIEARMTLQQVLDQACKRPRAPVQASLLLVLIKSIARDSSGAEDLGVVLADETAEMSGSLHPDALSEHPGALVVGAALALRQVPVLSLALYSHVLVIAPSMLAYAVPPHSSRPVTGPGAATAAPPVRSAPPPQQPAQHSRPSFLQPERQDAPAFAQFDDDGAEAQRGAPSSRQIPQEPTMPPRPPPRVAPRRPTQARSPPRAPRSNGQMPSAAEVARLYAEVVRGDSIARQRLDGAGSSGGGGRASGEGAYRGHLAHEVDLDEEAELRRLEAGSDFPEGQWDG